MKAVILDADSLGTDIDLSPIRDAVDQLTVFGSTSPEELVHNLGDADLILTNKVVIPGEVMAGRSGICVLATGTNNVDSVEAAALGLPVLNVSDYGTKSVAQHTFMLILALAAKLPLYQQDLQAGSWQKSTFFCLMNHQTIEFTGKTVVIVGAGHLGIKVANLAEAFGMQVQFAARPGRANDQRPSLVSLLPVADVISFHCPLTDDTRHLLNADRLAMLKADCLVVNCARGGIIDEVAALSALRNGLIGGLAVDVLPVEPPNQGHPLLDALGDGLNLLVTPHNAWTSREARQNIVNLTAQNIRQLAEAS